MDARPDRRKNGCVRYLALLPGTGLFLCLALYSKAVYQPLAELQENMTKWRTHGSSNYRITVLNYTFDKLNTIYIVAGKIILQTNSHPYRPHGVAPVEYFFKQLLTCVGSIFACSVEYGADYGYLTTITWGCIDVYIE